MTTNRTEFTDREKNEYQPAPCPTCKRERRKEDVEWLPMTSRSNFGQTPLIWALGLENCTECSKAPAEPGDEWRDELQ